MNRYQQLAEEITLAINSNTLMPGSALPSLRDCATQQGLSMNTVISAYRLLEDRGLIESRPQSGFFVCSHLPQPQAPIRETAAILQNAKEHEIMNMILLASRDPEYVDLGLATPKSAKYYPGEQLAKITASLLRKQSALVVQYALPPGSSALKEQIAHRGQRLGMQLAPDNIVITHGGMEALQLALKAVTKVGDKVGIEAPSYFNLYPLLDALSLQALEIPTHPQHGMDLDVLEHSLQAGDLSAIISMPTVQNPLGFTMDIAAKRRLADLVNQYQTPLIEDAIYAELQYAEPLQPTVKAFDSEGWIIICSSYSKALAPDYRIGWIEAGRFSHKVKDLKFISSVAESKLLSEAIAQILRSGGYDRHLRSLRRHSYEQMTTIRGLVARHFPPGTKATLPSGGFLLWIELPAPIDSFALFIAALKHKIIVVPGQIYSRQGRYQHYLRISCCQEIDDRMIEAFQTLGRLALQQCATQSAAE